MHGAASADHGAEWVVDVVGEPSNTIGPFFGRYGTKFEQPNDALVSPAGKNRSELFETRQSLKKSSSGFITHPLDRGSLIPSCALIFLRADASSPSDKVSSETARDRMTAPT